jgi:outer membrane protein
MVKRLNLLFSNFCRLLSRLVFLPSFFLVSVLAAFSVHALDLVEALKQAEENDASIRASYAEYQAAIESEPQSFSALLPTISLSLFSQSTTREVSNSTTTIPNSESEVDNDGYRVELSQTIYNQQLFDLMDQSNALSSQALASFEAAKQDLIIRLASAYFNVLDAQDNLTFTTAEKRTSASLLEQNSERFRVGMLAITDVKEAQAKYDTSVADEILAENNLSNAREALWVIINADASQLNPLKEKIPLIVPEPIDIDAWKDKAISNNLKLRAAQYARDAANDAYDSSRAGHYPTLGLTAEKSSVGSESTSLGVIGGPGVRDTDSTTIMLQLKVPIYSGGFTNSKIRQSASELDQAKALHEKEQRLTIQKTRTAFLGIQAAISRVIALKQALSSTETAVEATETGYRAGTRTSVDVLQIQGELFKSQRDYARSRYDYIINVLELKQAAGILALEDIEQINQWLVH